MTAAMSLAVGEVAAVHQFHGDVCLCGFSSAVSRDRTKHILTAALPLFTGEAERREFALGEALVNEQVQTLNARADLGALAAKVAELADEFETRRKAFKGQRGNAEDAYANVVSRLRTALGVCA